MSNDAVSVVKVKPLVWCDGCRAVGAIHCSDPENCGYMVSAEAAADSWKAWLDDLPLPEDFAVGIGRLEDFIDRIVANAIVEPPSRTAAAPLPLCPVGSGLCLGANGKHVKRRRE